MQLLPLQTIPFSVESPWFAGCSSIRTYAIDELMATKLRALYQRRKGRDLFDIWFVMTHQLIDLPRVIHLFTQYCSHDGLFISQKEFLQNLEQKKNHHDFQTDMRTLLPHTAEWHFGDAYHYVRERVIAHLP